MADEPNGTGGQGDQPPPPPLAPATPPPLGAEPPPLAATPPLAPPAAPVGKGLPAGLIAIGMVLFVLAVGAALYFGGVFDAAPPMSQTKTGNPRAEASGPAAPFGGEASQPALPAPGAPAPDRCDTVFTEQEAAARQPGHGGATNRIGITGGGEIQWNGAPIDATMLRQYLDITAQMQPQPVTVVRVAPGAPAAQVAAVRDVIGRALRCDFHPN